jgi:trehalose 6-phosphate synthase
LSRRPDSAPTRRRLIVVSNRGPVQYERGRDGGRIARRGGGGLVTALRPLVSHHDVTWIASAITEEDRVVAGTTIDEVGRDGARYRLRLVAHDEDAYRSYYDVVANPMLWFVHHCLWDLRYAPNLDRAFDLAWAEGYAEVNAGFAAAVVAELETTPDAAVFFHDYHLYLAPRQVREQWPDATLMHFVHVPWPQPDYWGVCPERVRRAIHEGLIANDVIGFQTDRWRRNFVYSAREFLGEDVTPKTVVAPISVDVSEFEELARSEPVLAAERGIVSQRPEKLIVRVDRTDPSKNIVRGFRAFELYLESHPDVLGRVGMLALLNPSRQEVPEYAEYLEVVKREAGRVNERFRDGAWTPIDLHVEDDFPKSVAAYKQFDVLLVNAIFDGMNLVAKEAALVNERDGVVVLSENAGAHAELADWAVSVNPFDVAGQAAALEQAMAMPAPERRRRLDAIRTHVREHDIAAWIELQLTALDRVSAPARR